ncbi:hemagglutinin repeat-containing protein [Paraburkholderia tropica]|uniref:hemagglutinin repeat-containing protein n=1 Tax=Paraburkholderia tropica TaxID=92647 RepID=UPI002AB61105|nr:hemagglutinin repeat-containing protein [Paraburkholderia tropica]
MNSGCFRLVFSKSRGMVVAVAETAITTCSSGQVKAKPSGPSRRIAGRVNRVMRHVALAALTLLGLGSALSSAQIVPSGAHAPGVINTANGLPQVNIQKPSGAGVSLNTYSQFDVSRSGAILNNSPVITSTQLAGQISGNPNFGANDAARIIVNQVNSNNPSRLNGYLEVAGQKASVVVANPSGIVVDGGGFINTTRGILTTGNPLTDANGNLTGFNVTGGTITVQGAGLNATNIDEVDLISRAVAVNSALYANKLNVVAGANNVDYSTLKATPTGGTGTAPGVAIDVSQLGGMYANRIILTSNENGVGVANAGTIASQAGDLTLTSAGQLVQTGNMSASGNVNVNAVDVSNSGTIYAAQNTAISSSGTLTNSGEIAAQQNTAINAGSVGSTGTLGAGINSDNTTGTAGDVAVTTTDALSATGQTIAAGTVTLYGTSLDLSGSQISSGTATTLTATGGSLALSGATLGTGTTFTASAAGALDTSSAVIDSGGDAQLSGAQITNSKGQVAAGGALNVQTAGALANQQGIMQAAGAASIRANSVDNTDGQILSLNGDGLTLDASGALMNGVDGVIGGNGNVAVTAAALTNAGHVSALGDASLAAQTINNNGGTVVVGGTLTAQAAGALTNAGGQLSGTSVTVSGASVDNSNSGVIAGTAVGVATPGAISNADGTIQAASNATVSAGGDVNNAHGTITANGTLSVSGTGIDNSEGTLTNAGTGQTAATATGAITNTGGVLGGNGNVSVNAQALANDAGAQLVGGGTTSLNVTGSVSNTSGLLYGDAGLDLNQIHATLVNDSGKIQSAGDVTLNVASLANAGGAVSANSDISVSGALSGSGSMTAGHDLTLVLQGDFANDATGALHADNDMTVSTTGTFTNASRIEAGNALTVNAASFVNAVGADLNSAAITVNASNAINNAGEIEGDSVTTKSATMENAGAIMGNNVQVYTNDVTNVGAQAVIAGATFVGVYAVTSLTNADTALIYSGGNMELARDNVRDSTGLLADQTGTIMNSASTIEAVGNIDVAANTLTNQRTGVQTAAGTPVTTTGKTLTLWTDGLTMDELGNYISFDYRQFQFNAGAVGAAAIQSLAVPLTVTLPASQVTSINTTAKTFSLTKPLTDSYVINQYCYQCSSPTQTRTITTSATQYYNSLTQNADGTVTIVFWPDYDPNTQIEPDQVQVRTDLGSDSHDYVELSRTVSTTTTTDQLINAGTAAVIQAQGSISVNADGGTVNNNSSTMAAGGNLVRRATGGSVNDNGTLLQSTTTETDSSVFYWHQKTGDSTDTQTVVGASVPVSTTTVASLPAIATGNQSVVTDAQNINITSVNRVGDTVSGTGVAGSGATGTGGTGAQTVGSAGVAIPGLVLPKNALYSYNTAPGADYLVETDPRFTSYSKFVSSDYMLDALGLNPQDTEKRLGDGLYEEQLVMDQVTQLTGRTFLSGYSDNLDEYTALMNNGVQYAQSLGLTVGVALSAAQMAELTTDMVWLVSQTVTLPDGTQQTVLVPQLYLAQSSTVDLKDSGALVVGNGVSLNASGDVSNSGVVAGDTATTVIGNNVVNRGVIGSDGVTAVAAAQDVTNIGGRIGGVETTVAAGNDIVNESTTAQASKTIVNGGFKSSATGMAVQSTGTISASDGVTLTAGRDVDINGATVQSGGDTTIEAARNINVGTAALTATQDAGTSDGLNGGHAVQTTNVGSTLTTGGNLTTVSGADTTLTDAKVQSTGDATMIAGGNLTVTAAKDTSSYNGQSMGGSIAHHKDSTYDETAQGSNVNAGGDVTLAAGQAVTGVAGQSSGSTLAITGSSVTTGGVNGATGGAVNLASTGDISIGAVTEQHDANHWSESNTGGFISSDRITDSSTSTATSAVGSTVSGETVSANAAHDLTIAGSTVASTGDMALAAGHDLTITTTQDTSQSSTFHEEQTTGLFAMSNAGALASFGKEDQKEWTNSSSVTNNGSTVGSTDGSVSLSAGNNLHVTGSDVIAAKDITGTAANVIIDSATDTAHYDDRQEVRDTGLTFGLGGSVGDAINSAATEAEAASNDSSTDARASALHSMAGVGDLGIAGTQVAGVGQAKGSTPDIGVQLNFASNKSTNTYTEDSTTSKGSIVTAGGTATFVATGDGTAGSGNVNIAGSDVSANDVVLAAANQVNLTNTTNTFNSASTNSSSGYSFGGSYGTSGWGGQASVSNSHGDANDTETTVNNTHVTGTNSVSIVSGGDTNIIGADVKGGTVSAVVGGNLDIESVQDTASSAAHQSSSGFSVSGSQRSASASVTAQNGHADSSYAQVNEQAGIEAGDGGFNLAVAGNTNLNGAVISSTADASKNTLTTGSLTFGNIDNSSHYSAVSNGISAGLGTSSTPGGSTGKATGPASVAGVPGVSPMISQDENGDDSSVTRSAISAATINITDQAAQTQDVSTLSRDTTNTNGNVAKTPDVNAMLSDQADLMQAAQAAGQVVAQGIGTYADAKRDALIDAAQTALDKGDLATAQADVDAAKQWLEGGSSRAELQIIGGALIGGLGGGSGLTAAGGAAGAGLSSLLAEQIRAAGQSVADATDSQLLGNLAGNVLAGVGGALVGGTAGAATGSAVNLYNENNDNGNEDAKKKLDSLSQQIVTAYNTVQQFRQNVSNAISSTLSGVVGQIEAQNGQNPPADANPLVQANDGGNTPSGTAGAVVTPPVFVCTPGGACVISPPVTSTGISSGTPSNATLNNGGDSNAQGNISVESGAQPDSNEVRAGQGLASLGYDVDHQATASSQGIPDVRTADLSVTGVGQVDVYTPVNTNPNSIVRNIEAKFNQGNGVVVQVDLSESDMTSIAARVFGKPNAQNFNTIFFQNSAGEIFTFSRSK